MNKSRRVWVEGMGFEVSGVFDFMIPEFRLEILNLSFSPACCRSQEEGSCLHGRVLNSVFFRLRGRHPFHGFCTLKASNCCPALMGQNFEYSGNAGLCLK